jgi:hypothetical protein
VQVSARHGVVEGEIKKGERTVIDQRDGIPSGIRKITGPPWNSKAGS